MSNKIIYSSRPFKMGALNFLITTIFRFAWMWILSLSIFGLCGLIIGITVDVRWIIVGLMIVFIILPMIFAFLYYFYGLNRECYINTVKHSLDICEEGIEITLIFEDKEENENKNYERKVFFHYDAMQPFRINSKSVIIHFKRPYKGFIWIPSSAFDENSIEEILKYLDEKIPSLISTPLTLQ